MARKRRLSRRQRHSFGTRFKWWMRDKVQWFKQLKWWQKTLLITCPIAIVVFIVPLLTFAYFALTMGDAEKLMNRNNVGVVLKDIHGETFYSTGSAEHRDLIPLDQISQYTQDAVIASEDKNFYSHRGVSMISTLRAVYGYVFSGGGEFGGSTLTQQLAKMTLLSSERGALRQYQAFSVAIAIEHRYSKEEILAMYLNSAFFGNNSFGVEQAAKNYFNKTPAELNLAESAMLVGLLPAPSVYSPITGDPAKAKKRQIEVLKRMVREGTITEAESEAAAKEELAYQPPATIQNDAPHFTEMVLAELYEKYGEELVERSGFQVTTTLDLGLQRKSKEAVDSHYRYIQNMGGSNAGVVAIDPKTGQIRALIGSADYKNPYWGALNIAAAKRQPGSTFKTLYYAAALADGNITPATIFRDEPINIGGYQPKNATRQYYGDVTVRQSLAWSLNIPSVKIMQQYGIDNSVKAAKKFGITTLEDASLYGLSLAIGSAEVPLMEMTNAYAALADAGQVHENTTIDKINDKFDKQIYSHQTKADRAISGQGAYLVSHILSDNNARARMFGSSLTVPGKTVAVKTGTTDENRDAWTIGYTPEIAIGVWVGNNDNAPMRSGGSDMAAPIWRAAITHAIGQNQPNFSRPDGIVERNVCYGAGGLAHSAGANTYLELFLIGALPSASCSADPEKKEEEKQPEEEPVVEEDKTEDVPVEQEPDQLVDPVTPPDTP